MIDTNKTNFLYNLLLTVGQFEVFARLLEIIYDLKKLSQIPLSKTIQSSGFLGGLLGSLMKGFPLMKKLKTLLTKSALIPLGLTAEASATDVKNHTKISRSGIFGLGIATLIISNK